jgi:hypothetical protein
MTCKSRAISSRQKLSVRFSRVIKQRESVYLEKKSGIANMKGRANEETVRCRVRLVFT